MWAKEQLFFEVEFQCRNIEEMMETENYHHTNITVNTFYRKELSIDAKIRGQKDSKCDICITPKYLFLRYLSIINGTYSRELCR